MQHVMVPGLVASAPDPEPASPSLPPPPPEQAARATARQPVAEKRIDRTKTKSFIG
jgi:hypothetical protein